jgi:hypothetical protein
MAEVILCQSIKTNKHIVKCEHGKEKYRCIQCGGASICIHKKEKYICSQCNGKGTCHHNKQIRQCKDCKGINICEHNVNKSTCKTCKGISVCEHNKQRCRCKICNPNSLCEHNILKCGCKICNPSILCTHDKRKTHCLICNPNLLCEHNKRKNYCNLCKGSQICQHEKRRNRCVQCNGSAICKCCQVNYKNPKYNNYCFRCFIYLFPNQPVCRNYKTKETATAQFITTNFPNFTWSLDKKVEDGCSRRRPDLMCDLGYQVIIVEVDENQHIDYDCSCENKRIMQLSQDLEHRPIVFIRFNPDDYINSNSEKITSCWGTTPKTGIIKIKNNKINEWNERLEALKGQIEYWSNEENKTEKTIEIIQLFYNM